MSSNIEIRILDGENVTQYIIIIREYTKEPIMEIKHKIVTQDVVLRCEYIGSNEKLEQLVEIIKKLESKGAQIEIRRNYQGMSEVIDISIIRNLIRSYKIIAKQVEEDMNREAEE